ncbi:MAG: hypothetical protein ABI690_00825 [Chloroflexota bacterium]
MATFAILATAADYSRIPAAVAPARWRFSHFPPNFLRFSAHKSRRSAARPGLPAVHPGGNFANFRL